MDLPGAVSCYYRETANAGILKHTVETIRGATLYVKPSQSLSSPQDAAPLLISYKPTPAYLCIPVQPQ